MDTPRHKLLKNGNTMLAVHAAQSLSAQPHRGSHKLPRYRRPDLHAEACSRLLSTVSASHRLPLYLRIVDIQLKALYHCQILL